ncbi:fimbrial biogenesis chaperone [Moellerella wisconsensis]|uniref:Molecular chaperone n=2 Tax=Moellerella wisconsensis TaxID=158849 RepID=A0A9Q8Q0Z0_9GAMM|nr:molecular chaperone [Moellerella wisconsensis]KLN96659.1 molecular chaperone [Moellerella wisconsensis]UNH23888.1 molecular chaperone [Moellerella wisconsensis]UNH26987.1 molecular chaperone [Moellerella wisconsensis]UNH30465.1 molecular chaperone [Moellerella wisconsensis]UNH38618.1 molecular chaperone [Moellerella wisconsensis]
MNLNKLAINSLITTLLFLSFPSFSAIALDRTRVIYNEGQKSVSIGLTNESKDKPYLSQTWLENEQEEKLNTPFIITPPVQRIEFNSKSQVKIQAIGAVSKLPQDRESVFYINVREIPPRSSDVNVLQIALQTRIKLFYRPKGLGSNERMEENPLAKEISLIKTNNIYTMKNPTPYNLTVIKIDVNNKSIDSFEGIMIEPFSQKKLELAGNNLGDSPFIYYLNDFGGLAELRFKCQGQQCLVISK